MLPAGTKTAVTFQFTDVAVASGGGHLLRLGFTMNNGSGDPQLCDSSLFSLQLSDGTVLDADASANAQCDPDMIDPGSQGKSTMYFNLPKDYTGPVTLFMVVDDKIVGQGTTNVQ